MTGRDSAGRQPGATCPSRVTMLTPRGRGAIASLSVAGPHALADVQRLFSPLSGPPLTQRPLNRPVLGHWHLADRRDATDELLVVCRTCT